MSLLEELNVIETRIKELKEIAPLLEDFKFIGDISFSMVYLGYCVHCKFEDLRKVRAWLRLKLGTWSDRLESICASQSFNLGRAYYNSAGKAPITIIAEFPKDETPKALQKSGKCGFKKRLVEEEVFSCSLDKEETA